MKKCLLRKGLLNLNINNDRLWCVSHDLHNGDMVKKGGLPCPLASSLRAQVLTSKQATGISHHLQLWSAKATFSMSGWRSQGSLPVSNPTHKMGVLEPREPGPDYPHSCPVMGQELHLGKQQKKPELPSSSRSLTGLPLREKWTIVPVPN